MKKKFNSITIKFIALLSILMAFIMAIQLYYNYQAQSDILEELTKLNKTINTTTDRILWETLEQQQATQIKRDSLLIKHFGNEQTDYSSAVVMQNKIPKFKTWIRNNKEDFQNLKKFLEPAEEEKEEESRVWVSDDHNIVFEDNGYIFNKTKNGSRDSVYEIVEVDLNFDDNSKTQKIITHKLSTDNNFLAFSSGAQNVLSFEFPNLVFPDEPKKFRYNYNTEEFNEKLADISNKNLFLTLGLFALSLLAIAAITGKFLKPIKLLNQSFDKVVQGDLDVKVESRSKDEMGELSASFNHMVNELRKNKDREVLLHRNERLASLGQLAAGVAHEIKNPLNAINLTIEHLLDKFVGKNEKQAVQYINTIQNEIRRLDKSVNNLLNYLRSENIVKKETDVNLLLDEILHLYEREIFANKVKLEKKYNGPCLLNIDIERYKTVLMNIILNAVQSMEQGGRLIIKTNQQEKSVTISDSGVGIPAKNLENIFDLFYTTKSSGTGLGLPTAHKIIQEHGGSVNIDSTENKGTTVKIILT